MKRWKCLLLALAMLLPLYACAPAGSQSSPLPSQTPFQEADPANT